LARPLDHSLKELESMLLKMGEQLEVSIHEALKAFEKKEVTVAQEVIREDHHVDEDCIRPEKNGRSGRGHCRGNRQGLPTWPI
jgi:phosphate uptake regulator